MTGPGVSAPEDERNCPEHPDQPWDHPDCDLDNDPYGYIHTPPVPPYGQADAGKGKGNT